MNEQQRSLGDVHALCMTGLWASRYLPSNACSGSLYMSHTKISPARMGCILAASTALCGVAVFWLLGRLTTQIHELMHLFHQSADVFLRWNSHCPACRRSMCSEVRYRRNSAAWTAHSRFVRVCLCGSDFFTPLYGFRIGLHNDHERQLALVDNLHDILQPVNLLG